MNGTRKNKSRKARDNFGTGPIMRKLQSHRRQMKQIGVKKLGLFGSAARGDMKARSDVDVVVEFDRTTYRKYLNLKRLLENILNRDVDLLTSQSVQGRLKEQIMKDYINVPTH